MRPTVERSSLVREIRLAFAGWTVSSMTTAGPTPTAIRPDLTRWQPATVAPWLGSSSRWLGAAGLAAALFTLAGCATPNGATNSATSGGYSFGLWGDMPYQKAGDGPKMPALDRKSTRLNSSH